jgi:hypothetical protein
MKQKDVESLLGGMDVPRSENIRHQEELKIPLLSYRRSSKAGFWLLIVPVVVAVTIVLKYDVGILPRSLDSIGHFFAGIDQSPIFTYLIPLVFIGFPLLAMVMNLLAFCHFERVSEKQEIVVTIKIRPLNIALFLLSFAVFVFFLLPDKLSF